MKQFLAGAALVALAACAAPMQQAAPVFDPVGVYDFTTEVQGTIVRGVLTLRRTDQGLTGTIATEMTGEMRLTHVAIEGRRGEMRAATDQGDMVMQIEFGEDHRIIGGWQLSSGLSGSVAGQRRVQQ
jgi:hypothetical protein